MRLTTGKSGHKRMVWSMDEAIGYVKFYYNTMVADGSKQVALTAAQVALEQFRRGDGFNEREGACPLPDEGQLEAVVTVYTYLSVLGDMMEEATEDPGLSKVLDKLLAQKGETSGKNNKT